MKAYSCCSGGVMFVPDEIERCTNKESKPRSYKDIVGEDAEEKPIRKKLFGLFFKKKEASKAA